MQLFRAVCHDILYQEARAYFLALGRSDFLDKSKLSLCGRFLISQKMAVLGYANFVPEDGIYFYDNRFYSTSYSGKQIFLALSQTKIAVDIEKIRERDTSLLATVSTISDLSVWESFYVQRTAKECLIKYLDLTQSEMSEMVFLSYRNIKTIPIDRKRRGTSLEVPASILSAEKTEISFFSGITWKVGFLFRGEKFEIYSHFEGEYVFALLE